MVITAELDTLNPQFIYDAMRKVGTGRATDIDGNEWLIEFIERHQDDSMDVEVRKPDGNIQKLKVTEDDFVFSDNKVRIQGVEGFEGFMHPVYLRKMRGFTRGNVPTPDIAGPTLP